MRAREFLSELKLDIPDQMVTVQVPLSTISRDQAGGDEGEGSNIKNPGRRVDSRGRYKWSPPLQQHLDAVKDSVGPSDQEVDVDTPESAPEEQQHSPGPGGPVDPPKSQIERTRPVAPMQRRAQTTAPLPPSRLPSMPE